MCIHPSELVDLSRLGYQLLAIVSENTEVAAVERLARDESLFIVYTTHSSGHTYVWGIHDPEPDAGAH